MEEMYSKSRMSQLIKNNMRGIIKVIYNNVKYTEMWNNRIWEAA